MIKVYVDNDGTIYVGAESYDSADGTGEAKEYDEEMMKGMQPVESADEALEIVRGLIEEKLSSQEAPGTQEKDSRESFAEGFKGVRNNSNIGL